MNKCAEISAYHFNRDDLSEGISPTALLCSGEFPFSAGVWGEGQPELLRLECSFPSLVCL